MGVLKQRCYVLWLPFQRVTLAAGLSEDIEGQRQVQGDQPRAVAIMPVRNAGGLDLGRDSGQWEAVIFWICFADGPAMMGK